MDLWWDTPHLPTSDPSCGTRGWLFVRKCEHFHYVGKDPPCLPPGEWDVLWLTPIGAVGSLCPFRRITQALRNGRAQDRSETLTRGVWHERPRTAAGNCR